MKIFVTGGTGFIGSYFVDLALSNGHEVVCLKRKGSSPVIELNKQPTWVEGDLNSNYYNYFKGCDVLVHLLLAE